MAKATMLTNELIEEITKNIIDGHYLDVSVALAGVSKAAFYNWIKKGSSAIHRREIDEEAPVTLSESLYMRLVDRVEEANAIAEQKRLKTITKAAVDDPKWAAWFLARRFGGRWGDRQTFDVSTKSEVKQKVKFDFSKLSDEQIKEFLMMIKRVKGDDSGAGEPGGSDT